MDTSVTRVLQDSAGLGPSFRMGKQVLTCAAFFLAAGCHTSPVQPCVTAGLSRIASNPQPPAPDPQFGSLFRAAGAEFHVSPALLGGIGWVETRWQMVRGAEEFPGRPAAYGVMGLRGEGVERGAGLAGVTVEAARQDPVAHIRAAAALLAAYAARSSRGRGLGAAPVRAAGTSPG